MIECVFAGNVTPPHESSSSSFYFDLFIHITPFFVFIVRWFLTWFVVAPFSLFIYFIFSFVYYSALKHLAHTAWVVCRLCVCLYVCFLPFCLLGQMIVLISLHVIFCFTYFPFFRLSQLLPNSLNKCVYIVCVCVWLISLTVLGFYRLPGWRDFCAAGRQGVAVYRFIVREPFFYVHFFADIELIIWLFYFVNNPFYL